MHMKEAAEIATPMMRSLGLEMSGPGTAAARQFEMQANSLGLAWDAVKVQIGEALMPQVLGLIGVFRDLAGPVITVVVDAVKGLMTANQVAASAIMIVWDGVLGIFRSAGDVIAGIAIAMDKVGKLDFKGAWDAIKNYGTAAYNELNDAGNKMVAEAESGYNRIKSMWSTSPFGAGAGEGTSGTKSAPNFGTGAAAPAGDTSKMGEFEDELKKQQVAEEAWHGLSVEEETAFWQKKLAIAGLSANDYVAIQRKIYDAQIRAGKEAEAADAEIAKQKLEISEEEGKAKEAAVMKEIKLQNDLLEAAKKAAEGEYKEEASAIEAAYKLRQISAERQNELLLAANAKLYATEQDLQSKLVMLWAFDNTQYQKMLDQRAAMDQANAKTIQKDNQQLASEQQKTWLDFANAIGSPIKNAFSQAFDSAIKGGQTFQQTMTKVLDSVIQGFVKLIEQIVEAIAEQLILNAITGGTSAPAGIAGTIGSSLGLFSASGGWDIPPGVNPVTQLHEKEMVLPAETADKVRNATGGGGATHIHYHVSALSGKDAAQAVKQLHRKGYR
jgi:hypothetical protein